jgi:hypothetical protein
MADFKNRYAEILGALDEDRLTTQEHAWLVTTLNEYDRAREELLDSLVATVQSFDPKKPVEGAEWKSAMEKGLARASEKLARFKKWPGSEPMSTYLRLTVLDFSSAETHFWASVKKANAGAAIDRILRIAHHLEEKRQALEDVWEENLDDSEDFKDKAADVADELHDLVEQAIRFAAENNKVALEKVAKLIKDYESRPEGSPSPTDLIPSPTVKAAADAILMILGKASEWYLESAGKVQARQAKLQNAFQRQKRLCIAFSETRDDVAKFLKEWNLEEAEEAFEDAARQLDGMVASHMKPGQKADLAVLKKEVLQKVDLALHMAEARFENFVDAHEEKFFGPVSSSVRELLTHEDEWESQARQFPSRKLVDVLREYEKTYVRVVSIDGLEEKDRKYFRDALKGDFDKLMKIIKPYVEKTAGEDVKDSFESLATGLKQAVS